MESTIAALLADKNQAVDKEWALGLLAEHPTFVLVAAMLLARQADSLDAETRQRLQAAVALGASDPQAWCDYADFAGSDWAQFYPAPARPKQKSTEDTIDAFINAYGKSSEKEDALLERLIFNPVPPDYLQGVEEACDPNAPLALPPELAPAKPVKKEEAPAHEEKPVEKEKAPAPVPPPFRGVKKKSPEAPTEPQKPENAPRRQKAAQTEVQNHLFMESLAKIFIKQQRYERALEIINTLSLNYPEKSAYFADQIRFLQKLIINQRHQASKTS